MEKLPTYDDVLAADQRISGDVVRTPLLRSDLLDNLTGGTVFLKAENLQHTGSFKFRGATNAIKAHLETGDAVNATGVIACSSGNHAQGVAEASRIAGISATIVMPSDAPSIKVERTRRSGADILFYDRSVEDREVVTEQHQERLKAQLVHPYNDPYVVAGQGTCGLEAADQLQAKGLEPDHVLVCTGGGGLSAGIFLVMQDRFPSAQFHTVEPEGFDDYRRSLEAGERLTNKATVGSLCDAILTPMPGVLSFAILNGGASTPLVVSDKAALDAVAFAFHELKVIVEPGGAVTLAALLTGQLDVRGKVTLATLSGGNIDPEIFAKAISGYAPVSGETVLP
ncbi:MAG: threonine/serine dehydratase [Pseudomonadota bacterium]